MGFAQESQEAGAFGMYCFSLGYHRFDRCFWRRISLENLSPD